MLNTDDFLRFTDNSWQWRLPSHFNIAYACVRQHVESGEGQRLAMIVEDQHLGSSQLSYQQLDEQSSRFKSLLAELGVSKGDRVLIRLPNCSSYPVSFFGCLKHGAIAVPTSTLLSADEVAYLAKDSGASVLVVDKDMWPALRHTLAPDGQIRHVLLVDKAAMVGDVQQGQTCDLEQRQTNSGNIANTSVADTVIAEIDFHRALLQCTADQTIEHTLIDDPAYLVYTSGTTGFPKGVLHAHRALIGRLPASRYWFDFKSADRILHSGKFNWTYVLGSALMDPLFHGHTVIVHEGDNDAHTWPRLIQKHQCTIFIGVPTIYRQIIQKTEFSYRDVPSLRHCMSAGEHLSDEMFNAWRERFALNVYEAIGMSEFSYYISQHSRAEVCPGAAGFIQPGHKVTLLDQDFNEVAVNQEGIIAIADDDPGLFLGYWQLPQETADSHQRGYFITGDYARCDEQGYIWFIGRKDDIINTFGYRVSPHEVERVMKTHPDVADCVALADTIGKDKTIVSLCVICHTEAKVNEQQLVEFGQQHLARYKAPKQVHFFNEFPRTKNGKVLRKQLLKQLAQKRQHHLAV